MGVADFGLTFILLFCWWEDKMESSFCTKIIIALRFTTLI